MTTLTVMWLGGHKKPKSGQLLRESNRRWWCLDLIGVVDVVSSGQFLDRVEDAVFRTGGKIKDSIFDLAEQLRRFFNKMKWSQEAPT